MGFRLLRPDEAADTARRAAVCFGAEFDDAAVDRWLGLIDREEMWGLTDAADRVLAHGRLRRVDHWLLGRRVPTQHVASVAVPPEHRGSGAAAELMRAAVRQGASAGSGLSLLFPATVALYRQLGYEHAGALPRYRLDARAAPAVGPFLRRAEGDADWAAIRTCGDLAASRLHGPAVRPADRWAQLRDSTYHYVLEGPGGGLDAYLLFDHHREPGDWQYVLSITDWGALSARGLAGVVGLVGRHGTVGKAATFRGPVPEVWSFLVAEQDVAQVSRLWWMARGLDLAAAIDHRGFPVGLTGSVTLAVDDPLLPDHRGPWRLEVAGGRGTLEPAPAADVRLDARAVGPLVTGFRTPSDLVLADLAAGPPAALDVLGAAFAGPIPVIQDFF